MALALCLRCRRAIVQPEACQCVYPDLLPIGPLLSYSDQRVWWRARMKQDPDRHVEIIQLGEDTMAMIAILAMHVVGRGDRFVWGSSPDNAWMVAVSPAL